MPFGVTGFIFEKTGKIPKFTETRFPYFYEKISPFQHEQFVACTPSFLQNLNLKQQFLKTNTFCVGILRV